jgi:hypothetical protein
MRRRAAERDACALQGLPIQMLEGSFGGCAVRWPVEPWPCSLSLYAIWRTLYSIKKRNRSDMILRDSATFST